MRYHDFSRIDERFHRPINDGSCNRLIEDFTT